NIKYPCSYKGSSLIVKLGITKTLKIMELSHLGVFHTIVGVGAIIAAGVSYVKKGKIDLAELSGKIYFYGTMVTSLTALGLSTVKGINPGHILAWLIVVLISVSYFLHVKKSVNKRARFFENF